jgi:hypothetical protein
VHPAGSSAGRTGAVSFPDAKFWSIV